MNAKKAKQYSGYNEKPNLPVCMNCQWFASEIHLPAWMEKRNKSGEGVYFTNGEMYTVEKHGVEKNLRRSAHGFAIKKMASCNSFKAREEGGAA